MRGRQASREFGGARTLGALVLAGFTMGLLGSAPPRDKSAESANWKVRVEKRLDELDAVGVDSSGYRAELAKAKVLAERGFAAESLLALRHLSADIEGWQPDPSPPRRPAEALLDATDRPRTWDPLEEGTEALDEEAGYGSFRLAPGDPEKPGVAIYRRPLSGPSRLDFATRIRQAKLKEQARTAQSSASRRASDWTEEADHPEGAVPGKVEARVGGGQVMEEEDDHDPQAEALVGNDGVGFYGSLLRMARQGIFPKETPDLPRPATGPDTPFDRAMAAGLKSEIEAAPDEGTVSEGGTDGDPPPGPTGVTGMTGTTGVPGITGSPDDPDLPDEPDLGGPEDPDSTPEPSPVPKPPTPAPVATKTPTPVPTKAATAAPSPTPDGPEDPGLDPDLDPDLPQGPGPKKAEGPAADTTMDALFADRPAFHEKVVALVGKLGPTDDPREPHVKELSGWTDVRGMQLFSLEEGALQVDVLARDEDLVGIRKAAKIRVEGLYLYDKAKTGKGPDQLLVARSVKALP